MLRPFAYYWIWPWYYRKGLFLSLLQIKSLMQFDLLMQHCYSTGIHICLGSVSPWETIIIKCRLSCFSLEIHAMISSWLTDGEMDSMVLSDSLYLNFALKMTVDGISQWNFVLVSLFKLPQKKWDFLLFIYFCLVSAPSAFSTFKNLSPKLAS